MEEKVCYSVVRRRVPTRPGEEGRYYALARSVGELTLRQMARIIQGRCTATRADVMAVLTALEDCIREGLASGRLVRLGEIGTFSIGLKSSGSASEGEFDPSQIRKAKVRFLPGEALKEMLAGLSYSRVEVKYLTGSGGQAEADLQVYPEH